MVLFLDYQIVSKSMCHLTFVTSVQIFDLLCHGLKDCSSWIFTVIFIQQCPRACTGIRILLLLVFLNVQENEMGQEKLTIKWVGNTIGLVQARELGSLPTVHTKFETPFQSVKWSGVGKPASSLCTYPKSITLHSNSIYWVENWCVKMIN